MLCINLFSFRFSLELILAPVAFVFFETVQIPMHAEDRSLRLAITSFAYLPMDG